MNQGLPAKLKSYFSFSNRGGEDRPERLFICKKKVKGFTSEFSSKRKATKG